MTFENSSENVTKIGNFVYCAIVLLLKKPYGLLEVLGIFLHIETKIPFLKIKEGKEREIIR